MTSKELISDLRSCAAPEKAKHSSGFFKTGRGEYGEGDKFLGIMVPEQRKIARKFLDLSAAEIESLLGNEFHEVRLTAVLLMVYKIEKGAEKELKEMARLYLKNISAINNWDLVDLSCHHILGRYLEDQPRDLLQTFARSNNLWKRRIAMVTCYHFIHEHDFEDALHIAEILLQDKEDLIQKAVGWMLREVGNRDLATEENFLKKHYQDMPRTMLRYAIEKFKEPLRLQYLHGEI